MAETNTGSPVGVEDILPVRSRISWAAIFAGAVVALAFYLILTLLGSAIGLSVSDSVRYGTLSTGAAVWAIVATIASLFLGGWVTTQCAVGENKREAIIHGIIMWGAVLTMILWLVASGVRTGFNAMLGVAYAGVAANRDATSEDWEASARRAGVSQETINDWKQKTRDVTDRVRERAEDPATRQAALETATATTWWTLLGTILSLASAVGGALAGSGPSFKLISGRVVTARATGSTRQYASQP